MRARRRFNRVVCKVGLALSRTALMEPPMFGFMEPLTGADLWSRMG